MCHWINRTCHVYLIHIHHGSTRSAKKHVLSYIIARIRGHAYKMLTMNYAILLHLYVKIPKIKYVMNISSKSNANVQ